MPKKKKETELMAMINEAAKEEEEIELVNAEIVDIMTIDQIQDERKKLEKRRSEVLLKLDKKRLVQAEKIVQAMDLALDKMIGYYDSDGNLVDVSAMDFKFLTDGYKNLINAYNLVTRLDSVSTTGKTGRISLEVEFEI